MHLGIDVGTISVKLALVDGDGKVLALRGPVRHEGRPAKALAGLLREMPLAAIKSAAATGAGREWVSRALGVRAVNGLRSLSRAFARLHPEVRTVFEIGGRDSMLIAMRELAKGEPPVGVDASRSPLCAAGTGSFLDQQAMRLGFSSAELARVSMKSERPANVSGRCSVFAKSDLIHLQQIGTRDCDMLAGLCYAVVRNFRSSVAKGRKIERPIALCGGVALNECVRKAVTEIFELAEGELILPERPEFMSAIGCAMAAAGATGAAATGAFGEEAIDRLEQTANDAASARRLPPLRRPSSGPIRDRETVKTLLWGTTTPVYVGVDIGSISTKVAVITAKGEVVARRYFWTSGRPLEAVRRAMKEIGEEISDRVEVRGVGTTGSGRYLVGDFIGADVIKNEISAQATAALACDPEVDTVFEIGGQDSKFIVIRDGTVVDFEMNKVCAAGTGSFLDEQAERMSIRIDGEFSDLAFASESPVDCGERCTVFMETDVTNYLAAGIEVKDLAAGLAYSIAKNYLSKVAGRGKIGSRVLFQGAVAFNEAVVAALRAETGREIRVTPDNEITGCVGVALIARSEARGESRFRGFEKIGSCVYEQSGFVCDKCPNRCDVRKVVVAGERSFFYGDRCDRYQSERHAVASLPDLFAEREREFLRDRTAEPESGPLVGIPRALSFMEVMPFWRTFLRKLGARTVLSGKTTRSLIERSSDHVTTEACMPVKAAHGHVLDLIDKRPDFIFLPSLVDRPKPPEERDMRYNCPFVQVWGHVVRAGVDPREHGIEVLDPVVFNALGERFNRDQLVQTAERLGASAAAVDGALAAAEMAQEDFTRRMRERGRQLLKKLPGGRAVVMVGRPYNACDPGLSLDLPEKLRKMGILPIPLDMMPLDTVDVASRWKNMYWHYGRLILAAASLVGGDDRLDMVFVTNFRCGPDSFITKYLGEALKGKPFLLLEFDDHSADAGVVTRLEAYLDSRRTRSQPALPERPDVKINYGRLGRTVYMPHMGDMMLGVAAACRGYGIKAEIMRTDETSLKHGLEFASGKECLPYVLCVGNMVRTIRSPGFDPDRSGFYMPSSSGSCRFGQYELGMRRVLDELGLHHVPIFSLNQSSEHFSQVPGLRLGFQVYRAIVAVNELERLVREIRPYEAIAGETDAVQAETLEGLCRVLESRRKPYAFLRSAARRFSAIETLDVRRPLVLVVGETYVRMQPFANCDVVRKIEALGGEACVPTFLEWVHHVMLSLKMLTRFNRARMKRVAVALSSWAMSRIERSVAKALGGAFRNGRGPHVEQLWKNSAQAGFVEFFGDASLGLGMSLEMARHGVDGIVNVMPFTCIPGSVARSQLRRAADLLGGASVLDVEFDGRTEETLREELEMFMEQAREHFRSRSAPAAAEVRAAAR